MYINFLIAFMIVEYDKLNAIMNEKVAERVLILAWFDCNIRVKLLTKRYGSGCWCWNL